MIYAIPGLNILGILPVESLPSRASGSNDGVERSILIEMTERSDIHKSSIVNRQSSIPALPGQDVSEAVWDSDSVSSIFFEGSLMPGLKD